MKALCFLLVCLVLFSCRSSKTTGSESTSHFGGIGASILIDSAKSLPYIVDIISGSPAAIAGLRSGDYIIAIDGKSTQGQNEDKVLKWLRGKPESSVTIILKRSNKEFNRIIIRKEIKIDEHPKNFCFLLEKALESPDKTQIYFWGQDSIQARMEYSRLVSNIRSCLPYTCCDTFSLEIRPLAQVKGEETLFFPQKIKELYHSFLENGTIVVKFRFHSEDGRRDVTLSFNNP